MTPENTYIRAGKRPGTTAETCLTCHRACSNRAAVRRRTKFTMNDHKRRGLTVQQESDDPRVLLCRAELAAHKKRAEERDREKIAAFRQRMHEIRTMSEKELNKSLSYMRPKGLFAGEDWR